MLTGRMTIARPRAKPRRRSPPLPVAALRLEDTAAATLRRLGLEHVSDVAALPRAPFARRFGAAVLQRLDQALGREAEPITPVVPPDTPQVRLAFPEPLLTAESFVAVIGQPGATGLHACWNRQGWALAIWTCVFERVDGTVAAIRIGTARPSRDARHLGRMLEEQVETIDPGLGVDAMRLVVPFADPLGYSPDGKFDCRAGSGCGCFGGPPRQPAWGCRKGVARRPGGKRRARTLGAPCVRGGAARARRTWPSLAAPNTADPPAATGRDDVRAARSSHPCAFTWRRHRHRVRRADGPERVTGEWWQRDAEIGAVRDYWQVEDERGRRFWLYRRGDGQEAATGDLRWFLHGVF